MADFDVGVYAAFKKDGSRYFRSSVTYKGKHISLGSFQKKSQAHAAYLLACRLLFEGRHFHPSDTLIEIERYEHYGTAVSFDKWVMLLNLRDNGIYCKNPILLRLRYFIYFLDPSTHLKFDADDLFYYTNHKIMRRGGHLFVADYGMQVNIMSRYGIKNHAVLNRDYCFMNGDSTDFRYGNIKIISRYAGVTKSIKNGQELFTARIHVNGYLLIGSYASETDAAVAYNKAADLLSTRGVLKTFVRNYIEDFDAVEYAKVYNRVRINPKLNKPPVM